MDDPGHLVSASRFATLTGVSRERLRTWERRHGFPVPRRVAGGPRRYAIADVARVVAVRAAADAGVPVPAAISASAFAEGPGASAEAFRSAFESLPLPALLLSGPVPLCVEAANAAVRDAGAIPRRGRELASELPAFAGTPAIVALRELFASETASVEVRHPAWDGRSAEETLSIAYRLPARAGERPLIGLAGLQARSTSGSRQAVAALERETERLRSREDRHARWLDAAASMMAAFQLDPEASVIPRAVDILVRTMHAVDGVVASSAGGLLVLPGSRRGLLEPAAMTVAAHPSLADALRNGTPLALEPATATDLGVPDGLFATAAPILVGGESLGALILVFDEPVAPTTDEAKLLMVGSSALGFALLRDTLVGALREVARTPDLSR